jgi:hypothetical protein
VPSSPSCRWARAASTSSIAASSSGRMSSRRSSRRSNVGSRGGCSGCHKFTRTRMAVWMPEVIHQELLCIFYCTWFDACCAAC